MVAIAASQPVAETAAVPVDDVAMEAEDSAIDMMPDESALKIIMHKLEHWLKKCYKKGGCREGTILKGENAKILKIKCNHNFASNFRLRSPQLRTSKLRLRKLWSRGLWLRKITETMTILK